MSNINYMRGSTVINTKGGNASMIMYQPHTPKEATEIVVKLIRLGCEPPENGYFHMLLYEMDEDTSLADRYEDKVLLITVDTFHNQMRLSKNMLPRIGFKLIPHEDTVKGGSWDLGLCHSINDTNELSDAIEMIRGEM